MHPYVILEMAAIKWRGDLSNLQLSSLIKHEMKRRADGDSE